MYFKDIIEETRAGGMGVALHNPHIILTSRNLHKLRRIYINLQFDYQNLRAQR